MIGQDGHGSPKPAGPNLMNIEHRFDASECGKLTDV
jgi:hypothetical protein